MENTYRIKLYEGLNKHHDAQDDRGRRVQIKATMKDALTFPVDHVPHFYLGIKINSDGSFEEIFNGPGKIAAQAINNRKPTKTNLHSVSLHALRSLNAQVLSQDRIEKKKSVR